VLPPCAVQRAVSVVLIAGPPNDFECPPPSTEEPVVLSVNQRKHVAVVIEIDTVLVIVGVPRIRVILRTLPQLDQAG
jgi:hypothetical protein